MSDRVHLVTETDPTPLVLRILRRLERTVIDPDLGDRLKQTQGTVHIRAVSGHPAATVVFSENQVDVVHGLHSDSHASFELIQGGLKPLTGDSADVAAYLEVLTPPLSSWQELAAVFWTKTASRRGTPAGVKAVCTDDGASEMLGRESADTYEIQGSAEALSSFFTGEDLLIDLIAWGAITAKGTMPQLSVMVGNGLAVLVDG